jgi:hypothetical protein
LDVFQRPSEKPEDLEENKVLIMTITDCSPDEIMPIMKFSAADTVSVTRYKGVKLPYLIVSEPPQSLPQRCLPFDLTKIFVRENFRTGTSCYRLHWIKVETAICFSEDERFSTAEVGGTAEKLYHPVSLSHHSVPSPESFSPLPSCPVPLRALSRPASSRKNFMCGDLDSCRYMYERHCMLPTSESLDVWGNVDFD